MPTATGKNLNESYCARRLKAHHRCADIGAVVKNKTEECSAAMARTARDWLPSNCATSQQGHENKGAGNNRVHEATSVLERIAGRESVLEKIRSDRMFSIKTKSECGGGGGVAYYCGRKRKRHLRLVAANRQALYSSIISLCALPLLLAIIAIATAQATPPKAHNLHSDYQHQQLQQQQRPPQIHQSLPSNNNDDSENANSRNNLHHQHAGVGHLPPPPNGTRIVNSRPADSSEPAETDAETGDQDPADGDESDENEPNLTGSTARQHHSSGQATSLVPVTPESGAAESSTFDVTSAAPSDGEDSDHDSAGASTTTTTTNLDRNDESDDEPDDEGRQQQQQQQQHQRLDHEQTSANGSFEPIHLRPLRQLPTNSPRPLANSNNNNRDQEALNGSQTTRRPQLMVVTAQEGNSGRPATTTMASNSLATTLRSMATTTLLSRQTTARPDTRLPQQQQEAPGASIGRRQQVAASPSLDVNMGADTMMIKRPALEPLQFGGPTSSGRDTDLSSRDGNDDVNAQSGTNNDSHKQYQLSLASFQERHKQLIMKNKQQQQQQQQQQQPGVGEHQPNSADNHHYRQQATTFAGSPTPQQSHELATESINHHVTARLDHNQQHYQAKLNGNNNDPASSQLFSLADDRAPLNRRQLESGAAEDSHQRNRHELLNSPATTVTAISSRSFGLPGSQLDHTDQFNLQRQDRHQAGAGALSSEQNSDNYNSNHNNNNNNMINSFNLHQQTAPVAGSSASNYEHQQQQQQEFSPAAGFCYTPLSLLAIILITMLATIVLCFLVRHLIKHLSFHQFDLVENSKHFGHKRSSASSGYLQEVGLGGRHNLAACSPQHQAAFGSNGIHGLRPTCAQSSGTSSSRLVMHGVNKSDTQPAAGPALSRGACLLHLFQRHDQCTKCRAASSPASIAIDENSFKNPYFNETYAGGSAADQIGNESAAAMPSGGLINSNNNGGQQQADVLAKSIRIVPSNVGEGAGGASDSFGWTRGEAPSSQQQQQQLGLLKTATTSSEQMHFIESHIANLHNRHVTSSVKELSVLGQSISMGDMSTSSGALGRLQHHQGQPEVVDLTSDVHRARVIADPQQGDLVAVDISGHDIIGLGFDVCGNQRDGIFIKSLYSHGPARESGCIQPGDRIKCLNVSFDNVTLQDACDILNSASPYKMRLLIEKKVLPVGRLHKLNTVATSHNTRQVVAGPPSARSQLGQSMASIQYEPTAAYPALGHSPQQSRFSAASQCSPFDTTKAYIRRLTNRLMGSGNSNDSYGIGTAAGCGGGQQHGFQSTKQQQQHWQSSYMAPMVIGCDGSPRALGEYPGSPAPLSPAIGSLAARQLQHSRRALRNALPSELESTTTTTLAKGESCHVNEAFSCDPHDDTCPDDGNGCEPPPFESGDTKRGASERAFEEHQRKKKDTRLAAADKEISYSPRVSGRRSSDKRTGASGGRQTALSLASLASSSYNIGDEADSAATAASSKSSLFGQHKANKLHKLHGPAVTTKTGRQAMIDLSHLSDHDADDDDDDGRDTRVRGDYDEDDDDYCRHRNRKQAFGGGPKTEGSEPKLALRSAMSMIDQGRRQSVDATTTYSVQELPGEDKMGGTKRDGRDRRRPLEQSQSQPEIAIRDEDSSSRLADLEGSGERQPTLASRTGNVASIWLGGGAHNQDQGQAPVERPLESRKSRSQEIQSPFYP